MYKADRRIVPLQSGERAREYLFSVEQGSTSVVCSREVPLYILDSRLERRLESTAAVCKQSKKEYLCRVEVEQGSTGHISLCSPGRGGHSHHWVAPHCWQKRLDAKG